MVAPCPWNTVMIDWAILLTLSGWSSPRLAEAFGVREDTVRLWRMTFMTGGVDALKARVPLGPVPVKDSEYVFELDYTFVAKPGFLVRPNVQYIYSPGGSSATRDVLVLGLKTIISF